MTTYQDVLTAIRNDADATEVEAMIADDKAQLTDRQMADLRETLAHTIITAAGMAGIDEIRRIAEKGWPDLAGPANDAVKAAAARIVERVDAEAAEA